MEEQRHDSTGSPAISLDQFVALNDELAALVRARVPLERTLSEVGRDVPGTLGVYVMGAYEGAKDEDNDPNPEDQAFGYTPEEYSAIFLEVIRDATDDDATEYPGWAKPTKERRTVVHEIGHQFRLLHVHKSVMATRETPSGVPKETAYDEFHEMHLALIRATFMP